MKMILSRLLPGSVSHPSGIISKSGHDFPDKPLVPVIPAAAKSLTRKSENKIHEKKKQ